MDQTISEEDLGALCTATGLLAINWAMIERQMDNCIHLIFACLGGIPREKEKPISLKRKIRALRTAFKKIPPLQQYKERAIDLLNRASEASEKRHAFIHGCISHLDGLKLTIYKLDPSALEYKVDAITFDLLNFPSLAEEFGNLAGEWGRLSRDLLNKFQKQIPE